MPDEQIRTVWVITGIYRDRSAAQLIGIYTSELQARDIVAACRVAGAIYSVNYIKMPLDQVAPQALEP